MAKKNNISVEVGDFIQYKNHRMAVIAIQDDKIKALCLQNHKVASIDIKETVEILKKAGCVCLLKAIYDDLEYMR